MSFRNTPILPNGYSTSEWVNGETLFAKDDNPLGSGEIFAFMWSDKSSDTNLYLISSSDNGQSWRYVTSHSTPAYQVQAMTQDASGRVHAISASSGTDSGTYLRISLSYTNKLISNFTITNSVALPNHGRTGDQLRADIKFVRNSSGASVLMYEVNMATIAVRPVVDIKAYMAYSTTLTPSSGSDFKKMDGSGSGDSLVFDSCTYDNGSYCAGGGSVGTFSNHIHTALFAQNAQSKDIYLFQGPIDADWGISYGGAADWITYTRMSTTANGWSVPSPATGTGTVTTNVDTTPGLSYAPGLFAVYSGSNYAWVMFNDSKNGIRFGRFDSSGVYSEKASPETAKDRNGWGVFTVGADDTKIWAVWYTLDATCLQSSTKIACGSPVVEQAYSDGSKWTVFPDPIVSDIYSITATSALGMAGVSGWNTGVAALLLNGHGAVNAPEQPIAATIWSN